MARKPIRSSDTGRLEGQARFDLGRPATFRRSLPPVANDNAEPLGRRLKRLAPGIVAAIVAFALVYLAFVA